MSIGKWVILIKVESSRLVFMEKLVVKINLKGERSEFILTLEIYFHVT